MNEIKIFVITLPLSRERQEAISMQLNSLGLQFEFIYGVNGKTLTENELERVYDDNKARKYLKRSMTRGEIGCALSHRLIYNMMVHDNIKRAVILEDDSALKKEFFTVMKQLERIKIDNYVIKLERPNSERDSLELVYTPWRQIRLNNKYKIVYPLSSVFLTWGYYIDILAAQTILNTDNKVFLIADAWEHLRRIIKLRIINYAVVECNDVFESTIEIDRLKSLNNTSSHKETWILKNIFKLLRVVKRLIYCLL
jgi:glycosyl transferase family 25